MNKFLNIFASIALLFNTAYAVVDYTGQDISGLDFTSGELANLDLRGGIFKDLKGALKTNFTGRDLSDATFWDADVWGNAEGAIFVNATLYGTDFTRTKLKDANFSGAYIGSATSGSIGSIA